MFYSKIEGLYINRLFHMVAQATLDNYYVSLQMKLGNISGPPTDIPQFKCPDRHSDNHLTYGHSEIEP